MKTSHKDLAQGPCTRMSLARGQALHEDLAQGPCTRISHKDDPHTRTLHEDKSHAWTPCTRNLHEDEPLTRTLHEEEPYTRTLHEDLTQGSRSYNRGASHKDEPCTRTLHKGLARGPHPRALHEDLARQDLGVGGHNTVQEPPPSTHLARGPRTRGRSHAAGTAAAPWGGHMGWGGA